jgi:endonuclease G
MKSKYYFMRRILLLLFFIPIFGISQVYQHSLKGEKISHNNYTLSYSENHEQAEWVYYILNAKRLLGSTKRTNNFKSDNKVSSGSAQPSNYKHTGYDRGHLAPASDMKFSKTTMSESFLMSNISPQNPSFNRGGWKKLETLVRSWAQNYEIHIVTAGVLNSKLPKLGSSDVSIPKFFYKIIYAPSEKKMIGFLMPNIKIKTGLNNFVKSVDEIEEITGIDFFYNLPDEDENFLESNVVYSDWNFTNFSISPSVKNNYSSSTSKSISVQCKGIAKSTGARCRNKTKSENQYCYLHKNQSSDYKAPKKSNYVGRCNAITKAGTQCKRNASTGSKFCWQHK